MIQESYFEGGWVHTDLAGWLSLAEMQAPVLYRHLIQFLFWSHPMRSLAYSSLAVLGLFFFSETDLSAHQQHITQQTLWQKRAAMNFLSQLPIRGNERVLDIGSGDGEVSAYLSIKVSDGSVLGVDICQDCAKGAEQLYSNRSFPNLAFGTADATKLGFNQDFDIVTSFSALHLIEDKAAALRSIKQSLRPEGRAILQCTVRHGLSNALVTLSKNPKWSQYLAGFDSGWHFADVSNFEQLLAEVDLKPRHFKVSRLNEVFNSEEEFKSSIADWLPHLAVIPKKKQNEFLEDLVRAYAEEEPFDIDGRIQFYVDRLQVEALNPVIEPRFQDIASEDSTSSDSESTE